MSGRSPLTLALRVGDHMMFVQLQLAAQHTPLQHRHVLAAAAAAAAAARGGPSVTAPVSSPCRPVSSAARVPPVSSSPAPASPSPVTAGSFRSHSAATCPEVSPARKASPRGPEGGCPRSQRCSLYGGPSPDPGPRGLSLHPAAYHASLPLTSRWTARPRPVLAASRPPPAGAPRPPPAGAPPPAPANPALSSRAS